MHYIIAAGFLLCVSLLPMGCDHHKNGTKQEEKRVLGMERYSYRSCDGGPHILLPSAISAKWKGHEINLNNALDPNTDYGSACGIDGDWGIIQRGGNSILVFANPPLSASRKETDGESIDIFVIQAFESEDLDALLDRASTSSSPDDFKRTKSSLSFERDGASLLFAGDEPGNAIYGESTIQLKAGKYRLSIAHYKGTGVEEVDIYRLQPAVRNTD